MKNDDFKLDENLHTDNISLEGTKRQEDEQIFETDGITRRGLSVERIIRPDGNISADANPKESIEKVCIGTVDLIGQ